MHPPEEFLKHAAECELMAKFARKPEDKATWNEMADRFQAEDPLVFGGTTLLAV